MLPDIVHQGMIALEFVSSVEDLQLMTFGHPTYSEVVHEEAAQLLMVVQFTLFSVSVNKIKRERFIMALFYNDGCNYLNNHLKV